MIPRTATKVVKRAAKHGKVASIGAVREYVVPQREMNFMIKEVCTESGRGVFWWPKRGVLFRSWVGIGRTNRHDVACGAGLVLGGWSRETRHILVAAAC